MPTRQYNCLSVIYQYRYTHNLLQRVTMLPQLLLPKALLVAALLTCLSGCGNTGDLYLPEDAPATQGTDNQPTEL